MVKIISISIPDHLKTFLDEHEHLSPSSIFQESLNKIIEWDKLNNANIKVLNDKIAWREEKLAKAWEFIRARDLWREFKNIEGDTNGE